MFSPYSSNEIDNLSFAFEQLSIQPAQSFCGCFNQSPIVLGEQIQRPHTPFYDESCSSSSQDFSYENENSGMDDANSFTFVNEYQ